LGKSAGKSPGKSPGKSTGKSTGKNTGKSTGKVREKVREKLRETLREKLRETLREKIREKTPEKAGKSQEKARKTSEKVRTIGFFFMCIFFLELSGAFPEFFLQCFSDLSDNLGIFCRIFPEFSRRGVIPGVFPYIRIGKVGQILFQCGKFPFL
jgi:hypothetical protein